jgi:hypothetical protein
MPSVTLFGFPRSVYVQMAGLYLTYMTPRGETGKERKER